MVLGSSPVAVIRARNLLHLTRVLIFPSKFIAAILPSMTRLKIGEKFAQRLFQHFRKSEFMSTIVYKILETKIFS